MATTTWELLYSHIKPKKVNYVPSVVSYLDILGFSELIQTRTAGEISRILRILAEAMGPERLFKREQIRFTKFSDTVIRTIPATPHNVVFELRHILYAQLALIAEGIPIRGVVTIGDVVQSWGIVYGPAVVRAYELERAAGTPPRVIVDPEILTLLKPIFEREKLDLELDYLLTKDGSTSYLDYLRACERELNVPEQEYPIFLEIHREFIRKGLTKYASNPRVISKYEWLRDYHDRAVEEYFKSCEYATSDLSRRFRVCE